MKNKISAILGPTNTGKTFLSLKKLLKYKNGVIGFPLRLLARENYEFTKNIVGSEKVALITGEEKIVPRNAKYFFCTVESVPKDISFEFVGIDEIQLASDFERGYIFTDKLLNVKGNNETVFMGSLSAEKILKEIYPEISIIRKSRLSKITYSGYKNITRLPKGSAVIAFSQMDVYQLATRIKQSHGGVSIVMGALSPDVRNAQVKLFEEGKVDYIVATDAIGLGLNLNIKHIFFSSLIKFDGYNKRRLTNDEIAQIAGRAGRYINDGYFGTTGTLKSLNNDIIKFVEDYKFNELKSFFWRNSNFSFKTPSVLIKNLSQKPAKSIFRLKRNATDERYFKLLIKDNVIREYLKSFTNVKTLWRVCGIPDYSKNLDQYHCHFLKTIFLQLVKKFKISDELIKKSLASIEKKTNKITELNHKLSQIRIWSFISYKDNWINNSDYYKQKVKQIESNLSLQLHSELMSHFVEDLKGNDDEGKKIKLNSPVYLNGNHIMFGKEKIGNLEGFRFKILLKFERKANTFKDKILKNGLKILAEKTLVEFVSSKQKMFDFDVKGNLFWRGNIFARFTKSKNILKPEIKIYADQDFLKFKEEIYNKIEEIVKKKIISPLLFLNSDEYKSTNQNVRAVNFYLYEKLGHCKRIEVISYCKNLNNKKFNKLGIRPQFGFFFVFYKNNHLKLKQMLINVHLSGCLENFMTERFYKIKSDKILKSKKKFFEKIGFYQISLKKKKFLVNFEYLENVISNIHIAKRRKKKFSPENILESLIKNNLEELSV